MISSHHRPLVIAALLLAASVVAAQAGTVTVSWDPDPDPDVTGYVISWGTASGQYPNSVDVGAKTTHVFTNMPASGKFYYVVRAYNFMGTAGPASPEVVADMVGNKPPSMTNPGLQRSKAGDLVSLSITATDQEGGGLKFQAQGLPPGLRMDVQAGVISGTVTGNRRRRGIYPVSLSVVDAGGATSTEQFSWIVGEVAGLNDAPGHSADFNADGRDDLLLHSDVDGDWMIALTETDKFGAMQRMSAPDWQAVPARLNQDAASDLCFYNRTTGAFATALNDGQGGFTVQGRQLATGWTMFAGQFDADPLTDLLFYSATDGRWMLVSNVDFSTAAVEGQWQPGAAVGVARFNTDALDDVMLHDPVSGAWTVAIADGKYGWRPLNGQWSGGYDVYPLNVNNDSIDDLLLYNAVTGDWAQALSNGEGAFTITNGKWRGGMSVRVGDFDGDGRGEVVLYDGWTGSWGTCTMSATKKPNCSVGTWFAGWDLVVGDFNGDKADDILFNREAGGGWTGFRFDGRPAGK